MIEEGNTVILIDAEVGLNELLCHTKKLDAILLTHGHFDHIKNLNIIAKHFNCPVYLHEKAIEKFTSPKKNCSENFKGRVVVDCSDLNLTTIKGGESLKIGDVGEIETIHTPGHTACSMSFKIGKNLFSGDTLFVGAVGRTDLWDSDAKDMEKSLKLLQSIKWDNLYPGHGEIIENIKNF